MGDDALIDIEVSILNPFCSNDTAVRVLLISKSSQRLIKALHDRSSPL